MASPAFDGAEQKYQKAIVAFQSALGCLKNCELNLDALPQYKKDTRILMMFRRLEVAKKALTVKLDFCPHRDDGVQLQGTERMEAIAEPLDKLDALIDEIRASD